jgi:hypothetical protein
MNFPRTTPSLLVLTLFLTVFHPVQGFATPILESAKSEWVTTANHHQAKAERGTLIVKLKKGASIPESNLILSQKVLFGRLRVVKSSDPEALRMLLERQGLVEYAERNLFHGIQKVPAIEKETVQSSPAFGLESVSGLIFNDPLVSKIWSFADNSGNGISVNQAYGNQSASQKAEIIVAVVDTGVDYLHEDLKDSMWVNSGEIPGNGIDDDRNGYIDDVYGINTLVRDASGNATGNPMASSYHGTHVAGTIAAKQNNLIGIAGIASSAKIMAIRAVPDDGDETDVDVAESYLYAARNGAKLINCSFGKSVNEGGMAVKETIDHVFSKYGALVVAAAGNDSHFGTKWDIDRRPKYPASYDSTGLMVVASSAVSGSLSSFSNVGKVSVDLAAPGSGIFSTLPGNKYGSLSGTSMATPTTVGMLAEVWSRHPRLNALQIKELAIRSVTPIPGFVPYMVSGGRANMAAMDMAATQFESGHGRVRVR